MSVVPDGFGEATLNFDFIAGPSNPMAIVFGYSHAGFNPNGHAQVIGDAWGVRIMPSVGVSDNLLFRSISVTEDAAGLTGEVTYNVVGPNATTALPPNVAGLVKKVSLAGGRSGRGRIYMPGLAANVAIEGGLWAAAQSAVFQQAMDEFLSDITGSDLPMFILHSTAALGAPNQVVSLQLDTLLATQRRRLR